MNVLTKGLTVSMIMGGIFMAAPTHAQSKTPESMGNYQFMKATDNRVWRLNVHTGEVAVCTLKGDNLLCTNNAEAMRPPSQSYKEFESKRAADEQARKAREMEFMDRAFAALRMLFAAGIDNAEQN